MTAVEKMERLGLVYRLQGIVECLDRGYASEDESLELVRLKSDYRIIAGRKISTYAEAALDLLGIEPYSGDDIDTKRFIKEFTPL